MEASSCAGPTRRLLQIFLVGQPNLEARLSKPELIALNQRIAVRSHLDNPKPNPDGSYDILVGPVVPVGRESNWVQTIPGKGWFTMVRLYGPKQEAFDGSWRLAPD